MRAINMWKLKYQATEEYARNQNMTLENQRTLKFSIVALNGHGDLGNLSTNIWGLVTFENWNFRIQNNIWETTISTQKN